MRRLVLVSLLALSLPATASTHIGRKVGSVETVTISGTVEVPLLLGEHGEVVPTVAAVLDDAADKGPVLFALNGASSVITVSDDVVSEYDLKVHTADRALLNLHGKDEKWRVAGEIKYVDIDRIAIGDLVLERVRALVSSSKARIGGGYADVQIGLGAVPGLAWAILPSEGVVRFAPAAEGAALVSAVGGQKLTYTSTGWEKVKFGKERKIAPAQSLIVPVTVGGAKVQAVLNTAVPISSVGADVTFDSTAEKAKGDIHSYWTTLTLGDDLHRQAWFTRDSELERGAFPANEAVVGAEILAWFDIAVDPAHHALALAYTQSQTRKDPTTDLLDRAEKAAKAADTKAASNDRKPSGRTGDGTASVWAPDRTSMPDDTAPLIAWASVATGAAGSTATSSEAPKAGTNSSADTNSSDNKGAKPDAQAWRKVARLDEQAGRWEDAIAVYKKLAEADEDDCSAWLDLGSAQLGGGHPADAIPSLERASKLYHSWWDLDHDTRKKYAKKLKKDSNDAPKGIQEQDSACYVADGKLAAARFATGDLAAVEDLYRHRLDLDPMLAVVLGNADIAERAFDKVQEPMRQALKLEDTPLPAPRLGLALAYAREGDWNTANGLFQKAMRLDDEDAMAEQTWIDAMIEARGARAALEAATAWADAHPDSTAAAFNLARAAQLAGDPAAFSRATDRADRIFREQLLMHPHDARMLATHARYLALLGRNDEAARAADQALQRLPSAGGAWLAKAAVYEATGQADQAAAARKKAATLQPFHPGYASLLAK